METEPTLTTIFFSKVGDDFVTFLDDFSKRDASFDAKDVFTSYTLDVISNAGLGVQANSFTDPDSLIRKKVTAQFTDV
jgi:hypothetical protein